MGIFFVCTAGACLLVYILLWVNRNRSQYIAANNALVRKIGQRCLNKQGKEWYLLSDFFAANYRQPGHAPMSLNSDFVERMIVKTFSFFLYPREGEDKVEVAEYSAEIASRENNDQVISFFLEVEDGKLPQILSVKRQ